MTTDFINHNLTYSALDDQGILGLIQAVRQGISYSLFTSLVKQAPFTVPEWSGFLHLSDRTMQRYKSEKKTFEPVHSERILEIMLLYRRGADVFGSQEGLVSWLAAKNLALGGVLPKTLLDTSFGIQLLHDELTRIEHGVLA